MVKNVLPDRPFLELSHVQNEFCPELHCCVTTYIIPAALMDCTNEASRVPVMI